MELSKKKKGGKKGGRGCKVLLVTSVLFLASCAIPVRNVPSDNDINNVLAVVNNQGEVLKEIIKVLQAKEILPKPEAPK